VNTSRSPLQRIARALENAGVQTAEPLLLGFSGGRDSVALALWLLEAGFSKLTLLHLDHGLRNESGSDAAWVAQFADSLGLGCHVERSDVAADAKALKIGVEEAGRNARYSFFASAVKRLGTRRVLVAHHADDQVETFLFRLFRGSGATGLRGMSASSARTIEGVSFDLLRPMLEVWRPEIDACIAEKRADFRDDPSNEDPRWTRNRIRHALMPQLEEIMGKPVKTAIWRAAELLRADNAHLEQLSAELDERADSIDVSRLRRAPDAIRRRLVMRWLQRLNISNIGFEIVDAVVGLALRDAPAKLNLPGGAHVRRRAGKIFIESPPTNARSSG
jgi:tRNA(Ile)-lysidine synthase